VNPSATFTLPEARTSGVFVKVFQIALHDLLTVHGAARVRCLVKASNVASIQLHERTGFRRRLTLRPATAPEPERSREIERHDHGELALLVEALHEGMPHARRDVPVDRADVVAGNVLADLGELEPLAAKRRSVGSREDFLHRPPAPDGEPPDLREQLGGDHGTSTRASSRRESRVYTARALRREAMGNLVPFRYD